MRIKKIGLFLDSGAYSAYTQGIKIDIDAYIMFIKKHEEQFDVYANLDVIGNSKRTWENQRIMEEAGLTPLPVFHYGENIKWLKHYLHKGYSYISFGGMVPITTMALIPWLNCLFSKYICNNQGIPKVRVHGFGLTSPKLALNYPWYSIDSSSWRLRGGAYGLIDIPSKIWPEKKEDYYIRSIPISKGIKGFNKEKKGCLFFIDPISQFDATFLKTPTKKKRIIEFIKSYGFELGDMYNNAFLRSSWNAIYLIDVLRKFSNVSLYLASNDFKSVVHVIDKIETQKEGVNRVNFLTSYASLPKKKINGTFFDKLVQVKKQKEGAEYAKTRITKSTGSSEARTRKK